ncbi:unnamed protein product [Prorocentrum cordatum]|uniref:P-type phospholipid transporter n=1 Tax=Prorocentrum cordatum TaxID=2364126 RepID=A0ABN9SNY4_9DINO|nr:unnamed protein product [Polarella glacialis]
MQNCSQARPGQAGAAGGPRALGCSRAWPAAGRARPADALPTGGCRAVSAFWPRAVYSAGQPGLPEMAHLGAFARRGLRTLCFATRELGAAELEAWRGAYAAAKATLSDDRADRIQACAEELETRPGLRLLGATAIEDQLQSEVPEVLQQVQEAGIRVWVLTGDKVETAISIAKSCRLLTEDMTQILLEGDGPDHEELLRRAWPRAGGRGGVLANRQREALGVPRWTTTGSAS